MFVLFRIIKAEIYNLEQKERENVPFQVEKIRVLPAIDIDGNVSTLFVFLDD
jgi:hypothetical protein